MVNSVVTYLVPHSLVKFHLKSLHFMVVNSNDFNYHSCKKK
ncbi:hypothetical protein XBJ2_1680052 [Xenorhabdus bovienii str. Jollieti]|uniref:Uncharacterized protein n=1 Tax=Xenorhabdus bovienii (strain SS-2004) TaxID=406818 RepID=D3V3Y9_XENBS|nr:hypothetical protein XBJ1_3247 [Xenorhabdus bovienii SS-2004]CDH28185.1 hypothetical protein XBJ2_1680052 [Xenorhabdus bovienii str. Jollieti]